MSVCLGSIRARPCLLAFARLRRQRLLETLNSLTRSSVHCCKVVKYDLCLNAKCMKNMWCEKYLNTCLTKVRKRSAVVIVCQPLPSGWLIRAHCTDHVTK